MKTYNVVTPLKLDREESVIRVNIIEESANLAHIKGKALLLLALEETVENLNKMAEGGKYDN